MKIVYIVNAFPKISETFILNEIIQVQNRGLEVEVIAFNASNEEQVHPDVARVRKITYLKLRPKFMAPVDHLYWLLRHPGRYLKTLRLALDRSNGITRPFLFNLHNIRTIDQAGGDIIHAHFGTWTTNLAMLAGLLTGTPYSFTTHSYDIFTFPAANLALKSRLAKKHITISDYNKNFLVNRYKVRPQDVEVVHCGVDFKKVGNVKSAAVSNKIVTIARLEKTKGLDHLIMAYDRLKERGCDFEAIIIGEGSQRPVLERLIKDLGLSDRVRLLGNRTQNTIFEILMTCRLMAMASTVEGIPVSLMEALAFRIPVVATRITGVPELIDDGISGFLVDPADLNELVVKIERLLKDESLRAKFVQNGYEKVHRDFDLEKEVKKLTELWQS